MAGKSPSRKKSQFGDVSVACSASAKGKASPAHRASRKTAGVPHGVRSAATIAKSAKKKQKEADPDKSAQELLATAIARGDGFDCSCGCCGSPSKEPWCH